MLLANILPNVLIIFVYLFFRKKNFKTIKIKSFKIFFIIVVFLVAVINISYIWLVLIKSEVGAGFPILELFSLLFVYMLHKEFNRRKNNKPPLLF